MHENLEELRSKYEIIYPDMEIGETDLSLENNKSI